MNDFSISSARGFTLLELLVVILIIGISISFISLNISPRRHEVEEEAKRIATLLNLARDEAILTGDEYALEIYATEYRFVRSVDDDWEEMADDEVFHARAVPDELVLELTIYGVEIAPAGYETDDQESTVSRIYLFSSGEITPFSVMLEDLAAGDRFKVWPDSSGMVVVEEIDRADL